MGVESALKRAIDDAQTEESQIAFLVDARCGIRTQALEYAIAQMRTFRTIRHGFPQWSIAQAAGDTAAAAGALAVILAADAHAAGIAAGRYGACFASSESLHAACIIRGPPQTRSD
jgi:hypothetical protein